MSQLEVEGHSESDGSTWHELVELVTVTAATVAARPVKAHADFILKECIQLDNVVKRMNGR